MPRAHTAYNRMWAGRRTPAVSVAGITMHLAAGRCELVRHLPTASAVNQK